MVVISDRRFMFQDGTSGNVLYYEPDVLSAQDYDPIGMILIGRNWVNGGENYRFGFNGYENTDEIYGNDIAVDFGARVFDGRLGRFFSIDPRTSEYSWQSPYAYFSNSPIWKIDYEGKGRYESREKDMNKFRKKENKVAKKVFGFNNYSSSTATDNQRAMVRDFTESRYKNKKWMWSESGGSDQDEMDDNTSLDNGTSRAYYRTRELVDQQDGVFNRQSVTTAFTIPTTFRSIDDKGVITLSADLNDINVNGGIQFSLNPTNARTGTVTIHQDDVAFVAFPGSPRQFPLLGPITLTSGNPTTAVTSINVNNGGHLTIRIVNRNTTLGTITTGLTGFVRTTPGPQEYHVSDNTGNYSFRKVKDTLNMKAGL